ncbi:unnamed protein product [Adineta ricciae]|uniref:Uncharacterized protein n=1 Tax=Adineta ricciae TaxID=249248 RepID=A0A814AA76_ADIRI|nr:unnamed protein product [Adineta ricciae]CAF0978855.1 unnamed protein product [Adineta ricciae]
MTVNVRLHASAEDLTKDYLTPYRVAISMTSIGNQDLPYEELEYGFLIDLLQELQNGLVRKPDNFNNLHFLLLLLYDAHGCPRDRYPLWRWYHRIKKKLISARHLTIDTDNCRQHILTALQYLIDTNSSVSQMMEEGVVLEEHYLNSPIHGLFNLYTPLHTYLYMEQLDKPIINENTKVYNLFQSSIVRLSQNEYNDLIHFSIAHRKIDLITKLFGEKLNWLDVSVNLTTERGWLPLHYAAYVGDKQIVQIICDVLTSPTSTIPFDTMSLFIPNFKQRQFSTNPNEYILKTCGVERDTHQTRERRSSQGQSDLPKAHFLQAKSRSNLDIRDQPSLGANILNSNNNITVTNDNDIPDADELELSSLPLIQRDEFIDKVIHMYDTKQMLIPSPLILACLATCGERNDYEEIVKILLDSHLVEYDGLNHECILNYVLDYMQRKDYASFQQVPIYRDTEVEGPSTYLFYQFDGFIVNQDVKPLTGALSGSSATLNTSKNDESAGSEDGQQTETPISVRCFLTVLVLRDIFLQYPRWDFHLLRENIEEHFSELENALGCRPTILYPDGDIVSSRKRSDLTWEVIVKYRLSSDTGQSLYMQVDYYFFESFADPFADALANVYQTPFYISCMTDSTTMMNTIFDSFFKRRHLNCWGTVARKHLEHCFDGVLQIKNNCTTFLSLCATLSRYYQLDGDPFIEENSATIQRMFVHAFACCVRRNAKIELDYLIKNHALIYYDSCRTKPSDIRHNILTYCVVRNLAVVFDQLMTNMKTTMYKTYQNSTNPDWQPHIAWREIIHVIIDPVLQQQNNSAEQSDLVQLACFGDANTNLTSMGCIPILHATGDEYIRCINVRKNIILKAKKKLPRTSSDTNKTRSVPRRMSSLDHLQSNESVGRSTLNGIANVILNASTSRGPNGSLTKRSKNIFKNVNKFRWGTKTERQNSTGISQNSQHLNSSITASGLAELSAPADTVSLPDVNDADSNDDSDLPEVFCATTPILTRPTKLRRRQTIDTTQRRQYSSRRTPFQHLQAMFRSSRDRNKTSSETEHEQMPMVTDKRLRKFQQAAGVSDERDSFKQTAANERRKKHRVQRRSDTVAIV